MQGQSRQDLAQKELSSVSPSELPAASTAAEVILCLGKDNEMLISCCIVNNVIKRRFLLTTSWSENQNGNGRNAFRKWDVAVCSNFHENLHLCPPTAVVAQVN